MDHPRLAGIPARGAWRMAYSSSLLAAGLMTVASVAGILIPDQIYPTEWLRQTALANDVANLIIGLPMLLGSLWSARRGGLAGLLLWPGALLYALYNYLAYAFVMPVSWIYMAYLILVVLTGYTIVAVVAGIDHETVMDRLQGRVPVRLSAAVLTILGIAIFLRVFFVLASSLSGTADLPVTELAVLLPDALLSPAWVIGGLMLWRRRPLGYVAGLGLLFQTSMLFIGLIIVLFLQPVLTNAQFSPLDVIVVAVMGSVTFVPTALFLRGAMGSETEAGTEDRPTPRAV
jgi:hypothetical protein